MTGEVEEHHPAAHGQERKAGEHEHHDVHQNCARYLSVPLSHAQSLVSPAAEGKGPAPRQGLKAPCWNLFSEGSEDVKVNMMKQTKEN